MSAALYSIAGRDGLNLRSESGVRALALPLPELNGALGFDSLAAIAAAETGRVVAEVALDLPGRLCLAVADTAGLVPRDPGDPNPRYTLYRIVPVREDGVEPEIRYGTAERLESLGEPCSVAALWQTTSPVRAAIAEDPLDTATGWTLAQPKNTALLNEPFDLRTGWTISPDGVPTSGTGTGSGGTITTALDTGANRTYLGDSTADMATATAAGWKTYLRWWANSHGPFTMMGEPFVADWHTLWPGARWAAVAQPYYGRSEANAKGALINQAGAQAECVASATPGFRPEQEWTLFVVAKARSPMQADQGLLFGAGFIGQSSGVDDDSLELHCGSATAGMRVVWGDRASKTFAAALSTSAFQIVELSAAAASAVDTWTLQVNGTAQTATGSTNGTTVPAWPVPPSQFKCFRGWWNSPSTAPGAPFAGLLSEVILVQTASATVRSAIRSYLASKFAITLP